MIDIKILNSEKELTSFPITQSLVLSSDTEVDTTLLNDHIILFRTIPEKGLISLVEPYSYTAGYIKDKFTTVGLSFTQVKEDLQYKLTITPTTPLELDSQYILYITKNLIAANATVTKLVSKSAASTLKVFVKPPIISDSVIKVVVQSTSQITATSNSVVFSIGSQSNIPLNLKQNNTVTINNIKYFFTDTVYVQGEEFEVRLSSTDQQLTEDMLYKFSTAPSNTIQVIKNQESSQTINTQDILSFYNKVEAIKETLSIIPKYIAPNLFSITLPEGFHLDSNKEVLLSIKEAFNNYLLVNLELYESDLKYKVYIYQEDSEVYIEVVYNETELDPAIKIVNENEEEILYKVKRAGI